MSVGPPLTAEDVRRLLEEQKREILASLNKQDPRAWRLLSIVLPVLVTGAFSFFLVRVQADMSDKVDRESKAMSARLSLTQDYFRERLRIYQMIHESVVSVKDKAEASSSDGLDSSVAKLYHSYANNSIFLTRELEDELRDLWRDCMVALRSDTLEKTDVEKISKRIDKVEGQMRRDLLIDELTAQHGLLQVQPAASSGAAEATKTP